MVGWRAGGLVESTTNDTRDMSAQFARAPHVGRSSAPIHGAPNAALLIDFDNVTMGIRSDLSKELKTLLNSDVIKGKVAVQRAYADWRRYPQYIVPLSEASVDLIFAPAYGSSKKNATDIRLAIDALELVFTRPEIGVFILLSGDSDFSSLVLKLKEYGKYVIGVGIKESSSDLLVQNCDEYYSYSALTGLTRTSEEMMVREDPWVLVGLAVERMAAEGDVMRSDRLKQIMLELDPNFDEKQLGYTKFNRFVSEAAGKGLLRLRKMENGQYEVAPPGAEDAESPRRQPDRRPERERREGRGRDERGRHAREAEPRAAPEAARPEPRPEPQSLPQPLPQPEPHAESQPGGARTDLRPAFDLLRRAVRDVAESPGDPVRDSDVKRRMLELQPGWDESQIGFSKFSRFLRQAHDAEAINLRRAESGVYEVVLEGAGAVEEERPARGRGRGRDGGRHRQPEPAEAASPAGPPPEPMAAPPEVPAPAARRQAPQQPPAGETAAGATPPPRTEPAPATPAAAGGARLRAGIGALARRGAARGGAAAPPPILAGQMIAPRAAQSPDSAPAAPPAPPAAPEAAAAQAEEPAAKPKSRRARGGRKRAGAAPTAEERPVAERLGLPTDADAVMAHLTSYKGVGRKTAEAVLDAFGPAGAFQALEDQPERVREVVGGGKRAETLLDAWRDDARDRGGASPAPVPAETAADAGEPDDADAAGPEAPGGKKGNGRGGRGRRGGRRGGRGRPKKTPAASS
jgi:uncharacterized protein (TIGR00288 family)